VIKTPYSMASRRGLPIMMMMMMVPWLRILRRVCLLVGGGV
jgi:hypothetical protein